MAAKLLLLVAAVRAAPRIATNDGDFNVTVDGGKDVVSPPPNGLFSHRSSGGVPPRAWGRARALLCRLSNRSDSRLSSISTGSSGCWVDHWGTPLHSLASLLLYYQVLAGISVNGLHSGLNTAQDGLATVNGAPAKPMSGTSSSATRLRTVSST